MNSPASPGESAAQTHYLIRTFTEHPLASNLLMIMMMLAGIWGLSQLIVQLNPTVESHSARIELIWPGAPAEDMERLVTEPVELQMRGLADLTELTSRTADSYASIELDFRRGTDMGDAMDRIEQRVAQTRDLPTELEAPVVSRNERRDLVGAVLLSGGESLQALLPVALDAQRELIARGIDHVEFRGVPNEEIAIQVDSQTLFELGVPLHLIAQRILDNSADAPAGQAGGGHLERKLRSLDQRRSEAAFRDLPLTLREGDELVRLGDIATIERRVETEQRQLYHGGEPAVMLLLRRATGSDALEQAEIMQQWQTDTAADLEQRGFEATLWLEAWRFARDTIALVLWNGVGGLLLVIATLYLFLNGRVAGWVTLGIPVSFLGALAVFQLMGGSINLMSMIGMVMALGIVVDDAIVVGEHALARFEEGLSPAAAASHGAQAMFPPVMASSLTTLAAFLPLIVLDSPYVREIPMLMIAVIIASLVECFLIMPGHLRHSFGRLQHHQPTGMRLRFDQAFGRFRDHHFLPLLNRALDNRRSVLAIAVGAFVIALSLMMTGRVKTDLNFNVDFEFAEAHIQFAPATPEHEKAAYLLQLTEAAELTNEQFGGNVVVTQVTHRNWANLDRQSRSGRQYAAVWIELVSADKRQVTLEAFSEAWREHLPASPWVEYLQMGAGEDSWPPIQLYFSGEDVTALKAAAEELKASLATYPGVTNVIDDLPYGAEQWIFSLRTEGRALGLTTAEVGRQIRAAFEGQRVQLFTEADRELEVRVQLPEAERNSLASIRRLPITTPGGEVLPLSAVADLNARRGLKSVNHRDTRKTINVFADVDLGTNTPMAVIRDLEEKVIPDISARFDVSYGLGAGSAEEARVLRDLMLGALIGLALIYLILAWIFASWTWPLAVMAAIPLGLTGALAGLQILDLNLGAMAIMGLFTLTGVIVNDSIILISTFRQFRRDGMAADVALVEACRRRLRPVILTSLTTTLGLAPLMLESSPMGDAMSPLAVVICFGLLYGTTLILFVIPTILSLLERGRRGKAAAHVPAPAAAGAAS